jgi:hypothetical protein
MRLDVERLAEYATRFEITVNTSGLVVIHFYDKHGGLFDVLPAESFQVEEKPRRCDCESSDCHPSADCQNVARVKTTHSRICVECAAKMPAKYLQAV